MGECEAPSRHWRVLPWAACDVLAAIGSTCGESAVSAAVFNGIAFCYECDMSARRSDSGRARGRRARPAQRGCGRSCFLGRRPNRRSAGEFEERLVAPGGGSLGLGMQWLNELPFADNRVLQIGFLAACGIAALIVLAIFYRLAFAHRLRVPGGRTRQPRLGLVDAFSLDGQRQLVLVRRDNVEHLVMIGGPNDVLVESQINRAAVPARENSQASPLLVPSTPVRRTEVGAAAAPTAAEAPAKVAAKAPASPPAPAPAQSPAPAAPAAPHRQRRRRPPRRPRPPPSNRRPRNPRPKPIAPEQARPASAPPPAAQAAEPSRPAPASSPPPSPAEPRPAQPRPVQSRAGMPPPIVPANASANRGSAGPLSERAPPKGPVNPPASSPAAPSPTSRPERQEQAVAAAKGEQAVAAAKAEPPAAPAKTAPPAAPAKTAPPAAPTVTNVPPVQRGLGPGGADAEGAGVPRGPPKFQLPPARPRTRRTASRTPSRR